jgi:hypothetical protein
MTGGEINSKTHTNLISQLTTFNGVHDNVYKKKNTLNKEQEIIQLNALEKIKTNSSYFFGKEDNITKAIFYNINLINKNKKPNSIENLLVSVGKLFFFK